MPSLADIEAPIRGELKAFNAYLDRLMRRRAGSASPEGSCLDWGICGVGLLPADKRMRDALLEQDHNHGGCHGGAGAQCLAAARRCGRPG